MGCRCSEANALFNNTWDDSRCDNTTKYPCGTHLDQQIATILWGLMVPNNISNNKYWSHFSIVRTVEENWGLNPLATADANATAFDFLLANPSTGNPSYSGGSSMSGNGIPGDQTNSVTSLVKASMSLGLKGMVAGLLGVLPSVVSF
ncbi:hypothetical protein BGZ89_010660 [Linnemannia elongata]|nr:hypothetical protein BGZ89_010660 [Linnemannia elongata]